MLLPSESRAARERSGRPSSGGLDRLTPELDRDAVDRQRDRRLGLHRLDPNALDLVVVEQALGDARAEALERAVGALLGDQRHQLADLRVVDGVLELGLAGAVAGVEGEAADLDRHRLALLFILLVIELLALVLLLFLLDVEALRGLRSPRQLMAAVAGRSGRRPVRRRRLLLLGLRSPRPLRCGRRRCALATHRPPT